MNKREAKNIVELLLSSYPGQASFLSDERVGKMAAAYFAALEDLDACHVEAAIAVLVLTAKKIPTIADIRERVVELSRGTRPTGGEAWGIVVEMITRYGWHRWPGILHATDARGRPLDDTLAATVRAFGWHALTHSTNAVADRARFIELYGEQERRAKEMQALSPGAQPRKALPARVREDDAAPELLRAPSSLGGAIAALKLPVGDAR